MILRALVILSLMFAGATSAALLKSDTTHACGEQGMILGVFKPWYYGISQGGPGNCTVDVPNTTDGQRAFVWTIVLNIVENLILAAGIIAVGFIIYGGILFMLSTGDPSKAAEARKTIINALAGAIVAGSAVLIVNLVARTALGIGT